MRAFSTASRWLFCKAVGTELPFGLRAGESSWRREIAVGGNESPLQGSLRGVPRRGGAPPGAGRVSLIYILISWNDVGGGEERTHIGGAVEVARKRGVALTALRKAGTNCREGLEQTTLMAQFQSATSLRGQGAGTRSDACWR